MKKNLLIISLLAFATTIFGAGIVEKWYTDKLQFGVSASGDDKTITVDTGDGASNPTIKVDGTSKKFSLNTDLTIGDGASADQKLVFDKGSGLANPFMGYDQSSGKLVFSNDGTLVKKFGTGSGGGGGGINAFGDSDNANAEDGLLPWTNVGGSFVNETFSQNVIEGDQSFSFTPVALNDKVIGPTINMDLKKYHGITCEAGIEYYGGDENLELHVVDGNGDILNEDLPNNRKILKRENSRGPFSVSFICPRESDILGDANKGNLHIEIKNVGAGIAPKIVWDLTYLGDDRRMGTSVLPDSFVIKIAEGGIVTLDDHNIIDGNCSLSSTNNEKKTCNFKAGLFSEEVHVMGVMCENNFRTSDETIGVTAMSSSSFEYYTQVSNTGAGVDHGVCIRITATGADANKVVKTYKAIPVTSEDINTFSAIIDVGGLVLSENENFIDGDCSLLSSNTNVRCDFNAGVFSQNPSCVVKPIGIANRVAAPVGLSNAFYTWQNERTDTGSPIAVASSFTLICQKQGADYSKPQAKNIALTGITVNSYAEQSQKQVRVESCDMSISGRVSENDLCLSWIDSFGDGGTGTTNVTFSSDSFSEIPVCKAQARGTVAVALADQITTTSVRVRTFNSSSQSMVNASWTLTCQGVK